MYALQKAETYNIGSAAWSLTENCSYYVRAKLQSGTESDWEFYIRDCVGAAVTDVRKAWAAQRLEAVKGLTHTHTYIYMDVIIMQKEKGGWVGLYFPGLLRLGERR